MNLDSGDLNLAVSPCSEYYEVDVFLFAVIMVT